MSPKTFTDALPVRVRRLATLAIAGALACACSSQQSSGTGSETATPSTATLAARATDTAGSQGTTGTVTGGPTRLERDLLGEKAVPANVYYGVQTARAL